MICSLGSRDTGDQAIMTATTYQKQELPRCGSPLWQNIMYNLSANFLKLPLSGPLSVNDENAQNILSGKF